MSNYFNSLFENKAYFIAEIGGNFRNYDTGVKLIELARDAGADAVKIQTYKADTVSSKKAMYSKVGMANVGNISQYDQFKKDEINDEVQNKLFKYAKAHDILLFSTPGHISDCEKLEKLGNPIYKIGSDDAVNIPMLKNIAKLQKPIILSTGMCTLEEVKRSVDSIIRKNTNLCLLHCVTNYPARYISTNLLAIRSMQNAFPEIPIGFSDHSPHYELVIAAVALGAKVIEKHVTLNKNAEGPDHSISLLPKEFKKMVNKVRMVEAAFGNGIKQPAYEERMTIKNNRKSIVMTRSLSKGSRLSVRDFDIKRPGWGIEPFYADDIVGKILKKKVCEDDVLTWEHLKDINLNNKRK